MRHDRGDWKRFGMSGQFQAIGWLRTVWREIGKCCATINDLLHITQENDS